jgi:hypothetical protein
MGAVHSEFWATVVKSFLAVALGLCGAHVLWIPKKGFYYWWDRSTKSELDRMTPSERDERRGLIDGSASVPSKSCIERIRHIKGRRTTLQTLAPLWKDYKTIHKGWSVFYVICAFIIWAGWVVLGIFISAWLLNQDQIARWEAQQECGNWAPNMTGKSAGRQAQLRIDMVARETRAAEYARDCYDVTETRSTNADCDFFYQSTIPFNQTNVDCPFADPGICDTDSSAIKLDTGE